ncbi:uncharacterized protein EV420DRAFT_84026 [Desarmillaria tabescens]|uniref:Uncharacterized protein n=1 Tax=Armillaria tabescens TaxID=1929756 RepID=A0AA39U8Y8_ARMTA|nr:uncharacterized protein EV420DRAFT_84026 [Desarmillaria tabescens]KAK0469995.1 hypothetical protein EV420DRAFT_84026 [Desarmillaria tabescens]
MAATSSIYTAMLRSSSCEISVSFWIPYVFSSDPEHLSFIVSQVCPLLWVIGSLALCLPLQHIFPRLFVPRRRNIDSDVLSKRMRRTEIRWASVCLILTSIFFFVGAFVLIIKLYL